MKLHKTPVGLWGSDQARQQLWVGGQAVPLDVIKGMLFKTGTEVAELLPPMDVHRWPWPQILCTFPKYVQSCIFLWKEFVVIIRLGKSSFTSCVAKGTAKICLFSSLF